jgi:hypothetical protein
MIYKTLHCNKIRKSKKYLWALEGGLFYRIKKTSLKLSPSSFIIAYVNRLIYR